MPDKFFLQGDQRKSLRNIIAREMLVNTLIHREMTGSYIAKFVIEKASFFRNIGYSVQLGSGVRNLFKYTKFYSGKEPELKEGDVFKITVPLDDTYSFDFGENEKESADKVPTNSEGVPISADKVPTNSEGVPINADKALNISGEISLTEQQMMIVKYVQDYGDITSGNAEELLGIKQRRAREILKELVEKKVLTKHGAYKSTVYVLAELEE